MVGQGRFSAGNDEASDMAISTRSGGSRGSRGVEVVVMVDALVALPEPTPESVGSILGATLTRGRRSGVFDHGMRMVGPDTLIALAPGMMLLGLSAHDGIATADLIRRYWKGVLWSLSYFAASRGGPQSTS